LGHGAISQLSCVEIPENLEIFTCYININVIGGKLKILPKRVKSLMKDLKKMDCSSILRNWLKIFLEVGEKFSFRRINNKKRG